MAAILVINIASLVTVFIFYRRWKRIFTAFITPTAENEASPFGLIVDSVSANFARAIAAQAKATFMASQSAAVRGESAIEGDIAVDVASQNPLVAGILKSFPTLSKSIRRNPALLEYAVAALSKMKAGQSGVPGNNSSDNQTQFSL